MLHTKNYFSFFGMLASTVNAQLICIISLMSQMQMLVLPKLNKRQLAITTAVQNQTKIQK